MCQTTTCRGFVKGCLSTSLGITFAFEAKFIICIQAIEKAMEFHLENF